MSTAGVDAGHPGAAGAGPDTSRVLVSLPTFNEAANLEALVAAIHAVLPDADVLVIDDGSPDGTGAIADRLAAADPRVRVRHRPRKSGLGTAVLAGLSHGVAHGYAFAINMDADFSHAPADLPRLLAAMDHPDGSPRCDVAIGSRYVPGGGAEGWDWSRHFMSWAINTYSRVLLRLRPRDTSGSFRCYRTSLLARMDFAEVYSAGYSFMEEFLYRCRRAGGRLEEIPIRFTNRKLGKSKLSLREALFALWAILYVAVGGRGRPPAPAEAGGPPVSPAGGPAGSGP